MVPVVGEGLMAPLALSDLRRLNLGYFFKQQFFEVFNQLDSSHFMVFQVCIANQAITYYKLKDVKRINKLYKKPT